MWPCLRSLLSLFSALFDLFLSQYISSISLLPWGSRGLVCLLQSASCQRKREAWLIGSDASRKYPQRNSFAYWGHEMLQTRDAFFLLALISSPTPLILPTKRWSRKGLAHCSLLSPRKEYDWGLHSRLPQLILARHISWDFEKSHHLKLRHDNNNNNNAIKKW